MILGSIISFGSSSYHLHEITSPMFLAFVFNNQLTLWEKKRVTEKNEWANISSSKINSGRGMRKYRGVACA